MNRETFIDTFRRALYGKIDDYTLADHVRYYENYIAQEVASGRSEQEVLDELGDPRLIAKTILETADVKSSYAEYTVADDGEPGPDLKVHRYEGWKGTLITVVVLIVLFFILAVVFRIVVALLPLLIVIGIAGWVVRKLWN